MHSESLVLELVELVYDAALDPQRWAHVLQRLCEALHGNIATIHHQHLNSTHAAFAAHWNMDPSAIETYTAHYAPLNLWFTTHPEKLHEGYVFDNESLCSDDRLLRSEFYNDWLKPNQMRRALGTMVLKAGSATSSLSIFRPIHGGPFHKDDERLMYALIPHLQRAFKLHNRIQGVEQAGSAALNALNELANGVILFDRLGRVVLVNRAASAILRDESALKVTTAGVRATSPAENRHLGALIRGAIDTSTGSAADGGGVLQIRRDGIRRPLYVFIVPLRTRTVQIGNDAPAVIMFVSDPEHPPGIDSVIVAQLFGLTPAEARLSEVLASGASPREAADRLGVAESTVRSQLKSVFAKTGTNRQSDLVRILLSLPQHPQER